MNLTLTKQRLKGAQTGHSLLAKKRDALTNRFRAILRKVDEAKRAMGRVLQQASFSLAEVTYATGDVAYQVRESVREATYKVKAKQENVSGVVLPAFEGVRDKEGGGEFNVRATARAPARRGAGELSVMGEMMAIARRLRAAVMGGLGDSSCAICAVARIAEYL